MPQYIFFIRGKDEAEWKEFSRCECANEQEAWDVARWSAHYSTTGAVFVSRCGAPAKNEPGRPPYTEEGTDTIRRLARQSREAVLYYIACLNTQKSLPGGGS